MKIGRRSASHDDHPNVGVAASTACDTRSTTPEPVLQRYRDELLDQLGPVPDAGRLEVAARSKRPGPQRKLERPEAGAFHIELDAHIGAAEMAAKRCDPVSSDVRDTDLPPLERWRLPTRTNEPSTKEPVFLSRTRFSKQRLRRGRALSCSVLSMTWYRASIVSESTATSCAFDGTLRSAAWTPKASPTSTTRTTAACTSVRTKGEGRTVRKSSRLTELQAG